MARAKRNKSHRLAKTHDRRAHRGRRSLWPAAGGQDRRPPLDPLGRLHSHRQVDEAQYQAGRAFQNDWERAERGPKAVDPTREYVDGARMREPITEGHRKAVLRLNTCERELGADGDRA